MSLRINDIAPDFTAQTTRGEISFHEWLGDSWGVLFSHPKDFTPVCTTKLGALAGLQPEFDACNVKIISLSVDPVEDHKVWLKDIADVTGHSPDYPIIADTDLSVAKLYNMLPREAGTSHAGRSAVENQAVRSVFIVGTDKRIKLSLTYPMATGRNFAELIRAIDSLQLTATHKVATPANWQHGDDVIIVPSVSDDEARKLFPDGWQTIKPYLRKVDDPSKP
jgi:alkyl hydroperoxide reductase subunit AhpC